MSTSTTTGALALRPIPPAGRSDRRPPGDLLEPKPERSFDDVLGRTERSVRRRDDRGTDLRHGESTDGDPEVRERTATPSNDRGLHTQRAERPESTDDDPASPDEPVSTGAPGQQVQPLQPVQPVADPPASSAPTATAVTSPPEESPTGGSTISSSTADLAAAEIAPVRASTVPPDPAASEPTSVAAPPQAAPADPELVNTAETAAASNTVEGSSAGADAASAVTTDVAPVADHREESHGVTVAEQTSAASRQTLDLADATDTADSTDTAGTVGSSGTSASSSSTHRVANGSSDVDAALPDGGGLTSTSAGVSGPTDEHRRATSGSTSAPEPTASISATSPTSTERNTTPPAGSSTQPSTPVARHPSVAPAPPSTGSSGLAAAHLRNTELVRRGDLQRLASTTRLGLDITTDAFGPVRVDAVERAGALHMTLSSDDATTRHLLTERSAELRDSLGDSLASFDVDQRDRRRHTDDTPDHLRRGTSTETPVAVAATAAPGRRTSNVTTDGQLDLRI